MFPSCFQLNSCLNSVCAHLCAPVRTCAHTHYSDMNSTGKQLGNMFSTTLLLACNFLTTFIIFGILCAQVRTGAHRCAPVRTCAHNFKKIMKVVKNLQASSKVGGKHVSKLFPS